MPQLRFQTASGIPETVKGLFTKKFSHQLLERTQCLMVAVSLNLQGTGIVKAHHADEALAVDLLDIVANQYGKGLNCCAGDKFLYVLKGMNGNIKFLHSDSSRYTKRMKSCIMDSAMPTD